MKTYAKNKLLKKKKKNNIFFLLTVFIFFLLITNTYYTYSNSLVYGGSDGRYYIRISEAFPGIANDIEYIKGERFFFPYLIGGVSKLFSLEIFLAYRVFVLFLIALILFFLYKCFKKIKTSKFYILISLSFIIFNPYIFRFYLAIPTIINDLFFMFSTVLIIHGFINKNKKNIFLGFIISILSRQNSIFFLISFLVSKFYFKEKSSLSYKDLFYFVFIFFILTSLNTTYAINANSSNQQLASDLYIVTLFGIFFGDYTFSQLIKFIFFPFLSIAPLIVFYYFQKKNLKQFNLSELTFVTLLTTMLIFVIAFVSGPAITGKNIIRLINLGYPMLVILMHHYLKKSAEISCSFCSIIIALFIVWSFHPTFSTIKIFNYFKFLFI
jgi:hypothetical protein